MKKFSKYLIVVSMCLLTVFLAKSQSPMPPPSMSSISTLNLQLSETNWDLLLDSIKKNRSNGRLTATSTTFNGAQMTAAKVQYKGNSSYFNVRQSGSKKLPFNIKIGDQTLKLANGFRDPSLVRDVLSYDIVRDYMIAPQAGFIGLQINGKSQGIYTNVTALDEAFFEKLTKPQTNTFFVKCDPEWMTKPLANCPSGEKASLVFMGEDSTCYKSFYDMERLKNPEAWKKFIQFVKILNQSPQQLESVLDVDQTLWMLALDNIMVNLDSYIGRLSHNFYLFYGNDGRFHPVIWDLNLSFVGFTLDGATERPLTIQELQTLSPMLHATNPKRPLVSQLLKNPTYQRIYIAHYRTILKDWFANGKYLERAKNWQQLVESNLRNDENKLYPIETFKENLTKNVNLGSVEIVGIETLMKPRVEFLRNHPLFNKTPPKIAPPVENSIPDGKMSIKVNIENAKRAWLVIRNSDAQPFSYLPLADDGQHNDDQPNDHHFGVVFEPRPAGFQYYIIAENDEAAATFPEKASKEYLTKQ